MENLFALIAVAIVASIWWWSIFLALRRIEQESQFATLILNTHVKALLLLCGLIGSLTLVLLVYLGNAELLLTEFAGKTYQLAVLRFLVLWLFLGGILGTIHVESFSRSS